MRSRLASAAFSFAAIHGLAQAAPPLTGNALTNAGMIRDVCENALKTDGEGAGAGVCLAYLGGVMEGYALGQAGAGRIAPAGFFGCPSINQTLADRISAFVHWMDRNPDQRPTAGAFAYWLAMRDKYPCTADMRPK